MDTGVAVSVLMPVYNGGKYLAAAIESVLSQTFGKFEFIVIDDGSTDESWDILNSFADVRLRLMKNGENLGLTKTLNTGLSLAQGEYVARMDQDDICLPERLAQQVAFLESHQEIGVLGTGVRIINGSGATIDSLQFPTQHAVLMWCLCFTCPILHPTVMMRRHLVQRVGGYSSNYAEDYDLWRRLSRVTRLANLEDVLLHLRKHDVNMSNVHASEQLRVSIQVSRSVISRILNEDVSAGTVQRLWDQEFRSADDLLPVAELMYRLYRVFASDGELSMSEKRTIRKDAARRLYDLSRPWVREATSWGILARACFMDPELVTRVVKGWVQKNITRGPAARAGHPGEF